MTLEWQENTNALQKIILSDQNKKPPRGYPWGTHIYYPFSVSALAGQPEKLFDDYLKCFPSLLNANLLAL